MGGYRIDLLPDQYPDGRKCVVASHPDLPGCIVYADTDTEAVRQLEVARNAYLASLIRHGEDIPLPQASTSAHWQLSLTPTIHSVTIEPTRGASPALQTA